MIALLKLKETIPTVAATLRQLPAGDLTYIREGYEQALSGAGIEPRLAQVIDYALSTQGSMMRAQLGFMVMRAVGAGREDARHFGVAVELFHTASLLFDDMPAMDDATYRRGKLCTHLKFSEADATLGALALITRAYDLLFTVILLGPDGNAGDARVLMTKCLGAKGILSGQSADVHYDDRNAAAADVLAIANGKTGTLLRLLLVFPALLYKAAPADLAKLERIASSWGCAYQVLDDIKDGLGSERSTGKTVRRDVILGRPNYFNKAGEQQAWTMLTSQLADAGRQLGALVEEHSGWACLCGLQAALVARAVKIREQVHAPAHKA